MTDHSEFPWGPQVEPGLLTPFGVIGWVLAGALLLLLILRIAEKGPVKTSQDALENIYKTIQTAAQHAVKQSYFAGPAAAHLLCETIRSQLGGVLALGSSVTAQLEALEEALGVAPAHGHGHGGHGPGGHGAHGAGHGGAHGSAGHAAGGGAGHNQHTAHQGHAAQANDVPGAVANTVQGHSITVNLGGKGGACDPVCEPPEDGKPLSLPEQLVVIEGRLREFRDFWANKPMRMAELRAAQDNLTKKTPPSAALKAATEEKK